MEETSQVVIDCNLDSLIKKSAHLGAQAVTKLSEAQPVELQRVYPSLRF